DAAARVLVQAVARGVHSRAGGGGSRGGGHARMQERGMQSSVGYRARRSPRAGLRVRDGAGAGRVAPEALDREGARAQDDVLRVRAGARVPRALVAVLLARAVVPRVELRVGDGLAVVVAGDDGQAVEETGLVDVAQPAREAHVGDVGEVRVRDGVARGVVHVVPVPRAVAVRLAPVEVGAGREGDDVVRVRGVAEVRDGPLRFGLDVL